MTTRIGEVYQVVKTTPRRYFQLVALDITQLNSDVIAVFSYSGQKPSDLSKIIASGVEFFTHTTVSLGAKQGLWVKVGRLEPVDSSKALFKDVYYKDGIPDIESYEADHYHSWVIWRIGEEWQLIGPHIDKYPTAELGAVYPPEAIVYRIQHGRYPGVPYYGQVR